MNRKYILGCICISLCASLSAGRKLNSVDKFRDVEIMEISWRGIHIIHQSGACILTTDKLSEAGKLLLKDELQEVQQLQKKREEEAQQLQKKCVEEQTRNVELAIQNSKLADTPKLSLEILQEAEGKFSQATNRNQLQKEIKQKQEELVEYQKVKLAEALAFREQKKYKNAFEIFQEIAHEGHPEAQNYLAMMYRDGQGVKKNESVAFDWFQRSALQGHAGAQNNLAVMYADGKGIKKDFAKAMEWANKAADQNPSSAQLLLGKIYSSAGKYAEAVKCYQEAIKQGNSEAMIALAMCYRSGAGVPKNEEIARQWYKDAISTGDENSRREAQFCLQIMDQEKNEMDALRAAAGKGDIKAQQYLANYYYNRGQITIAIRWYERAGHGGDVVAQHMLGMCYLNGDGVPRSVEKARYWYSKAAANGDKDAAKALKRFDQYL